MFFARAKYFLVVAIILINVRILIASMGLIFRKSFNLSEKYFLFQNGKEFLKNNIKLPFSFSDKNNTIEAGIFSQCVDHFSESRGCENNWNQVRTICTVRSQLFNVISKSVNFTSKFRDIGLIRYTLKKTVQFSFKSVVKETLNLLYTPRL